MQQAHCLNDEIHLAMHAVVAQYFVIDSANPIESHSLA
ncbi:Uncharacterised protein [Legionella pneumophila]|nr:Uncharacterised protein [Legionella pneumophila]